MTEGAYHAGNPSFQTYWRSPASAKTGSRKTVTSRDAFLRILLVPQCQPWPIPCMQASLPADTLAA